MDFGNEVVPISKRAHATLEKEAKRTILLNYWRSDLSMSKFAKQVRKEGETAGESTIKGWIKDSKLGEMKKENRMSNNGPVHDEDAAVDAITLFLTGSDVRKQHGIDLRRELHSYLTLMEQQTILKSSALLSSMGH